MVYGIDGSWLSSTCLRCCSILCSHGSPNELVTGRQPGQLRLDTTSSRQQCVMWLIDCIWQPNRISCFLLQRSFYYFQLLQTPGPCIMWCRVQWAWQQSSSEYSGNCSILQPTVPSNKPPTETSDDSALRLWYWDGQLSHWPLAKIGKNGCKQTSKFWQKWADQEYVCRLQDMGNM